MPGAATDRVPSRPLLSTPQPKYTTRCPEGASETPRGQHVLKWAWVDSNYRPHAYQALGEAAGSRQVVGTSGVSCVNRGCPGVGMSGFGGVCRHLSDTCSLGIL